MVEEVEAKGRSYLSTLKKMDGQGRMSREQTLWTVEATKQKKVVMVVEVDVEGEKSADGGLVRIAGEGGEGVVGVHFVVVRREKVLQDLKVYLDLNSSWTCQK